MPTPVTELQEWTIDELAGLCQVPSRTIREYQRLELLPPPRREGRVGRYGAEHQARLSIIGRLQDRGYSLAAIGDLMGSWQEGRGLGSILGVSADPAVLDEMPTEMSRAELVALVPAFADATVTDEAVKVGVLRVSDDTVMARSLAALEMVTLAVDAGMQPSAAVSLVGSIRSGAASMAEAIVDPFFDHAWPRRGELDLEGVLGRARLLIAQAAASLVVHELGAALMQRAKTEANDATEGFGELAALIDEVAIGRIRRFAPPTAIDQGRSSPKRW